MEKTLEELASWVHGELRGDGRLKITGVAGLKDAEDNEISFVVGPKYARQAGQSRAGALIVPPDLPGIEKPVIVTGNPYLAFAKILTLFTQRPRPALGVSRDAYLGAKVELGEKVSIHPQVYVGDEAVLGDRVT